MVIRALSVFSLAPLADLITNEKVSSASAAASPLMVIFTSVVELAYRDDLT